MYTVPGKRSQYFVNIVTLNDYNFMTRCFSLRCWACYNLWPRT